MPAAKPDRKTAELAASRTLNPHPETLADAAFAGSDFFDARDLVQVKYEMVRRVEAEDAPVARAAACLRLGDDHLRRAAVAAGGRVWTGNRLGRWFAVAVIGLNAVAQMFFIPAYPFWSLLIIAVDVVALWGLCAYGSGLGNETRWP